MWSGFVKFTFHLCAVQVCARARLFCVHLKLASEMRGAWGWAVYEGAVNAEIATVGGLLASPFFTPTNRGPGRKQARGAPNWPQVLVLSPGLVLL